MKPIGFEIKSFTHQYLILTEYTLLDFFSVSFYSSSAAMLLFLNILASISNISLRVAHVFLASSQSMLLNSRH